MKTVIMAGGKGTRFPGGTEKGMIQLSEKTLLERTVNAITESGCPNPIVAITSETPDTGNFAFNLGLETIQTPGRGYHEDVYFLLGTLGNFVSINVDIPFISSTAIDQLLSHVQDHSIACVIPQDIIDFQISEDSVYRGIDGKNYVWAGINYVTPSHDTGILVLNDRLLALNINTIDDLKTAERLLAHNDLSKR